MTHQPRRKDTIESDIQSNLENQIPGLTDFTSESFDKTWIDAYAAEIRSLEAKILAAQLALWVDYAARTDITQSDLELIGVSFSGWTDDEISSFVSDVNGFMEDVHLDQIGKLVGISRSTGQKATGKVTITTASDNTDVNEGLEVATEPDSNGNYQSFFVDADGDGEISGNNSITPANNQTTVDVDVIAEDVGTDYNVGSDKITFLPSPDPGIEDVTNSSETSGGEDEQTNESYRNDLKGSVVSESGGGTAEGVEGAVEGVSGVADVELDEFQNDDPPHVDVVVDGGSDADVKDEIGNSKPVGIQHDLVRPESINTGFSLHVIGTDIDTSFVSTQLEDYLKGLGMGQSFRRVKAVQRVLNADSDINDIAALTFALSNVVKESEVYNTGTDQYDLDFKPVFRVEAEERLFISGTDKYPTEYVNVLDDSNVEVEAIVNGDETVLTKGVDYKVIDDDSDGKNDTIDFSLGGTDPDDRTSFWVEYDIANPWNISKSIHSQSFDVSGQDATPTGLAFKPDGSKMYIAGDSNDNIEEYDLSTSWDVSSASHNQSFDVSGQDTTPTGVAFRDDGSKMYVTGDSGDTVEEYTLGTNWDISTASSNHSLDVSSQDTAPNGITFKTDGAKMYIAGNSDDDIDEYNLGTNWDLSSASHNQSFDVSGEDTTPTGVAFKPNGAKMYVSGDQNDNVYEYTLSTNWDVSTASHNRTFDVSNEDTTPTDLAFKLDGSRLYITGDQGDNVEEYDLPDPIITNVDGTLSSSDHTFTLGLDYDVVDNSGDDRYDAIDWSIGGDTPDDSTRFFMDYNTKRVIVNDLLTSIREKISLDGSRTSITQTDPA